MHFFPFWAKTRRTADGTTETHALACHLLDVAAVADVLLELFPNRLDRLAALLGADPRALRRLIVGLAALETVVPTAFEVAARMKKGKGDGTPAERQVRVACRDSFRRAKLLDRIIPLIEDVLAAGGLERPEEAPEAVDAAIARGEASGDDGHRN